jgi:hypothetical protein
MCMTERQVNVYRNSRNVVLDVYDRPILSLKAVNILKLVSTIGIYTWKLLTCVPKRASSLSHLKTYSATHHTSYWPTVQV